MSITILNRRLQRAATLAIIGPRSIVRTMTTPAKTKKEGDISSVFVTLSGSPPKQLPERFIEVKRQLVAGSEGHLLASWKRLLQQLTIENTLVAQKGPDIVPQIKFEDLKEPNKDFLKAIKKRGVAVVRGVVPEEEARAYKQGLEEYVQANPSTKAFPPHSPQVFELYWSPPQVAARSHPNLIKAQKFLMNIWHSTKEDSEIDISHPLVYTDRVRIRQPGDTGFALGPHVDGGSVERWEPEGYGRGNVYDKIWKGKWEDYDPWEASCRVPVVSDLYNGAGSCSMFRMFQGWLSMSHTGPNEGTLMVNPLLQLSTAYFLLRPFFKPLVEPSGGYTGDYDSKFLDPENWTFNEEISSELQGAPLGYGQELNQIMHPHLDLKSTMVHIPQIKPGDFVVWHCDTIHAVDKVHMGNTDSSVLYIPVCPVTENNAKYLVRQLDTFVNGAPGPDFPSGKGETEHIGRPTVEFLEENLNGEALQAMGLKPLSITDMASTVGAKKAIEKTNSMLGF